MRVTNASVYKKFTSSANNVHSQLIKSFNKVSSSKAYESAAENPLAYYQSKKIDNQYLDTLSKKSLIKDVQNRIYQQELQVRDIHDILKKAKQQVQYARTDTTTGSALASLRDDLLQKMHSVVNDLNGQYQDFYVFGGNDVSNPPFSLSSDGSVLTFSHIFPDDPTKTPVEFNMQLKQDEKTGEYGYSLVEKDAATGEWTPLTGQAKADAEKDLIRAMSEQGPLDIGYGTIRDRATLLDTYTSGLNVLAGITTDAVKNSDPTKLGGELMGLLAKGPLGLIGQAVQAIDKELKAENTPEYEAAQKEMHDVLGTVISDMTQAEYTTSTFFSDLGTKYKLMEDMDAKLKLAADNLTEQYSDVWGADPYEAIMEMYNNQYSYNAALKVGSQLLSSSLFDFMR